MSITYARVLCKPIIRIPIVDVTLWHYGILLKISEDRPLIMVNFGPRFPFLDNRVRIMFEEFKIEENKVWRIPSAYYWRDNSTLTEAIYTPIVEKRLQEILEHIDKSHTLKQKRIPPLYTSEIYDWNDYNCEHFCSRIMYGESISSQYDVFNDDNKILFKG